MEIPKVKSVPSVKKKDTKPTLFLKPIFYIFRGDVMNERLAVKMMKYGIPRLGALRVINELSEEQIQAAYLSHDYLQEIIEILYYKHMG